MATFSKLARSNHCVKAIEPTPACVSDKSLIALFCCVYVRRVAYKRSDLNSGLHTLIGLPPTAICYRPICYWLQRTLAYILNVCRLRDIIARSVGETAVSGPATWNSLPLKCTVEYMVIEVTRDETKVMTMMMMIDTVCVRNHKGNSLLYVESNGNKWWDYLNNTQSKQAETAFIRQKSACYCKQL